MSRWLVLSVSTALLSHSFTIESLRSHSSTVDGSTSSVMAGLISRKTGLLPRLQSGRTRGLLGYTHQCITCLTKNNTRGAYHRMRFATCRTISTGIEIWWVVYPVNYLPGTQTMFTSVASFNVQAESRSAVCFNPCKAPLTINFNSGAI
jgi:hypothetical protein